jgi:PIN domain nuclease of toxin-antitoxin system
MARARQSLTCLDTHIVAWLYAGMVEKLSESAAQAIETGLLLYSPIVALELQYLHEIGRLRVPSDTILTALQKDVGLQPSALPFDTVVTTAKSLTWTRDVFDRIIVATAMAAEARLITKDTTIRQHSSVALW